MDWDQWKGIWIQSEETRKPVIIVPKKRPRMGIDGTFIRPVGTVPENMTWDNARGVWIREGAPRGEEDEDEEGGEEDEGEGDEPASAVVAAGNYVVVAGNETGVAGNAGVTAKANGHSLARSRSVLAGKRLKPTYDGFNPNSPWQEPIRPDDDLTLFEVNRKPRGIMTGRIQRPVKSFSNFHCVICLGYIKNARIVMECLHRFCEDCIEKSLRMGRNECPICRTFVPSRRSLVPDPNFDRLIRSILGDFIVDEGSQEDEEAVPLTSPLQQAIHRKKKAAVAENKKQKDKGGPQEKEESSPDEEKKPIQVIGLLLQKHPQEKQAEKLTLPYLRIQGNANVGTLKTFLCRKLDRPFSVFQIFTTLGGKESALNDWTTLEVAVTEQLKSMKEKEASEENPDHPTFFYRIKKI
jgi:E3 ubiquitin-protein ligase RNF1/2